MTDFMNDYADKVTGGIREMQVTDGQGRKLSAQDGLEAWATKAKEVRDKLGGLTFFCGNGASATMAEHMSHDWFQNGRMNTTTCSETAHLTAIANDISYEDVFSYRIGRILSEKDILVTISSSGNSPNIVKAVRTARDKGAYIITLSGKSGDNQSRKLGDLNFWVPLDTYGLVESAHAVILHAALDLFLETYMGGMH
ncbi:MAG: SIS domain-containing protein [Treponema sp.]|nr:SIS domain-containing protein [Treponema sp.]